MSRPMSPTGCGRCGPRIDSARDQRAASAEALELVRLSGFAKRRIHEMSGGQQQRVALARAIVNRPARAAAGRAAGGARPQAAHRHADRTAEPAARARHHLPAGDPRPGRGAVDERPGLRDECRPGRADRRRRRRSTTGRHACSSPISSARPTACPAHVEAGGTSLRLADGTALPRRKGHTPVATSRAVLRPEAIRLHRARPTAKASPER